MVRGFSLSAGETFTEGGPFLTTVDVAYEY